MQSDSHYCPEVGLMLTTWRNSSKKRAFTLQDSYTTSPACWLSHSLTTIETTFLKLSNDCQCKQEDSLFFFF